MISRVQENNVVVTIYDGESGQQIGQRLVDASVVVAISFIRAFDNKAAVGIRPGSYNLKKETALVQIAAPWMMRIVWIIR